MSQISFSPSSLIVKLVELRGFYSFFKKREGSVGFNV